MKRFLKVFCVVAFLSVADLAVVVALLVGLAALIDTDVFALQLLATLLLLLLAVAALTGAVVLAVGLIRDRKKP